MSRLKKFELLFNSNHDLESEKEKFVTRINHSLFTVYYNSLNHETYESMFRGICYKLGFDASKLYDNDIMGALTRMPTRFHLKDVTQNDFTTTLKVIIALDEEFEELTGYRNGAVTEHVNSALSLATADLGVRWQSGMFFPSGAKELDEALIGDVLKWLSNFPDAKNEFKNALEKYQGKNLDRNLIDDLRLSLELLLKALLKNSKSLEKQKESLGEFLKEKDVAVEVRNMYVQNIDLYSKYQNERVKHNNKVRKEEVELMLYLTGTFMRFLSTL